MKKTNKTTLLFIASALAGVTAVAGVGTLLDVQEASANGTSVFEMVDGAGLRTSNPTGLRFKAIMTKDYYQQITTTSKDLYIAVIPYTYYNAYQSANTDLALYPWLVNTYGEGKILNLSIPDEKIYSTTVDGDAYYCANAVISNIRLNNYHLDFVGVAYITDGATYTDAGAVLEEDNARSVFEVAVKAYEDDEDRVLYKDFLEDTIEKGMYNAYGVKQDSATGKYVYNGASYDTFEEATTVVNVEDMTLTLEETTVVEGKSKQLNAVMSFGDGKEFGKDMYYTWASSNTSVATVDENGVVTANAVGTTEITVSALNGKYTATATLTVEAKPVVTVAEGVAFMAKSNGGKWSYETGAATINLDGVDFNLNEVEKVLVNGQEVAFAVNSATEMTLTNAPGGDQLYTFVTPEANYVLGGCIYANGISTVEELEEWRTTESYWYTVLLNDIDYNGATLAVGANVLGTLDGRGYQIKNFTYTQGFVKNMFDAKSVMKNVSFAGTQDCTGMGNYPAYGLFGQWTKGTLENLYLDITTTNLVEGGEHIATICYGLEATAKVTNVVLDLKNANGNFHYGLNQNNGATVSGIVGGYEGAKGSSEGGGAAWGTAGGFHAKLSWMVAEEANDELLGYTSSYWAINASARTIALQPWKKVVLKKTVVTVENTIMAKGSGGKWSYDTGAATVDLSGVNADLSKVESVTLDGEEFTSYTASGSSLTLTNAPGGDHTLVITTEGYVYDVLVCVYVNGISTVEELEAWRTSESFWYTVLLNDIDYEGATLASGANVRNTFDGRGYSISNFTTTNGFVNRLYDAQSAIKNVAFYGVTQDCSGWTGGIDRGVLGQWNNGTLENIYLQVHTINVAKEHYGVLCFGMDNGSKIYNVVLDVTSESTLFHYAMMHDYALAAGDSSGIVGSYANGSTESAESAWGVNSGFHQKLEWMIAEEANDELLGFTSPYWVIDTDARTIKMQPRKLVVSQPEPEPEPEPEPIVKTDVYVDDVVMAQGTAGNGGYDTNAVKVDLSVVEADFSAVESVLLDGEVYEGYTGSGAVLTLNTVRGGDHEIVITTATNVYYAELLVYANVITTVDQMNTWRNAGMKGYSILVGDIDYNGATIASGGFVVNAVLDGRGYKVKNFTMTANFVTRLYNAEAVVTNVYFDDITQDCSGWAGGIDQGVFGNWLTGVIENVYVNVTTINMNGEHYGVLFFGTEAGAIVRNVVVEIESECLNANGGAMAHYVHMQNNGEGAVVEYLVGSGPNVGEGGKVGWSGAASGFHQKLAWMVAEEANDELLGFTSEYWVIDATARTITMQPKKKIVEPEPEPEPDVPVEKKTVNVEDILLAKGTGGRWNQAIGSAPVNFSGVSADLSKIESVTLDGEEFSSYSASGATLTLTDIAGGDHTLVVTTETHIYNANICVYNVSISTVDELEFWRTNEHWGYTVLLNDIDCKGATLGAPTNNLCGILDGRGYTVSNFTVTNGFIKNTYSVCGTTAGIKNLQLKNAVQDCSFTTGNGTTTGILGQHVYGVFENIYIEMSTVNATKDHWGVLFYAANSGTIVKNVIINVTESDNNKYHYFMMNNEATTFNNVYGVYANGKAMYGSPVGNTDNCFERVDWMISTVPSIEAWGGYWQNTSTSVGLVSLKDKIEKGEQDKVEDGYLVKDGKTAYTILINDSDATMYGAAITELRTLFEEATGIQLSIVNDSSVTLGANDKFISFGNTDALSLSGVATVAGLGKQGYIIKAVGNCIYIWSEGSDGATYAVYDLMSQLFNFEQYSERVYTLDKATTLQLPSIEEKAETPDIEYRIAPTGVFTNNATALKRMRMVNNGTGFVTGGGMHNILTSIVPFATYYSTNKTWFSSKTKSTDTAASTQLCYTAGGNADSYNEMVKVAVDNVIALLQADKKGTIFAITQMDVKERLCACSSCYGKNVADLQTKFVNDVTAQVQVWLDSPDGGNGRKVQFATASYYETAVVPTLALNDNVSIWVAPISDNWAKAPDAEDNQMATLLNAWKQLAPGGVMLWAYNTYFSNYMTPFDSYDVLGETLQCAVDNGVYYFWAQGAWDSTASTAFESVKTYVLSKLMWDSSLNVNDLIDDYFEGVYGTGTVKDKMRAAFDAVRTHMKNSGKTQGSIYSEPKPDKFFGYGTEIWDKTFLNSQLALFNDAITALGVKEGAVYDSIVCETISTRWMLKEYRSTSKTSYDGSAWGTWAEDIARLGFNRQKEGTGF